MTHLPGHPLPAYASSRVSVYHCDACAVLHQFTTESVDLVVTDPPYGMKFKSGFREESFGVIDNDDISDRGVISTVLMHSVRLVGQHRHIYVFGPQDVLADLKVSAITELIWDKSMLGAGDLTANWGPAHEPISFCVSKYRHGGKAGADCLPVRLRKGSVLRFPRPTGRKVRHPNEKPVPLLRELIESSSRAGETVLDPFAGSGSTGVAALLSGRRAVLIEKDARWADLAIARIKTVESHLDALEAAGERIA